MVEPSVIRDLLDELRFDEAERLVDGSDTALVEEIGERRAEAVERAVDLCQRLIELGEERRLSEVTDLGRAPSTHTFLELAPESYRDRADLYLREAVRWEERHHETNRRRLTGAREALDGLDLELARGLVNKIDDDFLTEEEEQERDELLLDISARAMELESLSEAGDRLIGDREPQRKHGREHPWWRKWFD